jgi:hypothetical protein
VVPWQIPDETKTEAFLSRYVNDAERVAVLEPLAPGKVQGDTLADTYQKLPGMIAGKGKVLDRQVWQPTLVDMHKAGIDPETSVPGRPSLGAYAAALGDERRNETMMRRSVADQEKASGKTFKATVGRIASEQGAEAITSERMERAILKREGQEAPTPKFDHETNPGSGRKTSEARRIIAEAESGPSAKYYLAIKQRIAAMNETKLAHRVETGLNSQSWADQVVSDFGEYYTPHETVYDPEEFRPSTSGISVGGKEFSRATGRTTLAFNPFVQDMVASQTSFLRGENNRVAQKYAEFLSKNPELGRTTDSLATITDKERVDGRITSYKVGGEQRYAVTNDQRLADWARKLESTKVDDTLRSLDKVLGWLRKANTSWNPVFPLTNLPRDVGLALTKAGVEESSEFAAHLAANIPRAVRAMLRVQFNPEATGKFEDTYRMVQANGGEVGVANLSTMQKRLTDMQKELDAGVTRRALTKAGRIFLEINQAFESATRLAVAQTLLDHGKTQNEAVLGYRRFTADFARKGEKSALWSRAYLFFNANVQGTSGVVESFAKHPQRGATAAGLLIGMGYAFSQLSRAMADEDDDGISMWDKVTDYEKSRRLGIMFGDKYYGPPAPWGYGFFSALGYDLEHLKAGKITFGQVASRTLANLLENSSPLPAGSLPLQVTPTIARPFMELALNENFAGAPIKPELNKFQSRELQPEHMRKFKTVSPPVDRFATAVAEATGGDDLRSGKADFSPEGAEHLLGWFGGGIGRFGGRVLNLAAKSIRGDPVYLSDWPGLRSFVSTVPEFDTSKRYYDNITKIEAASARLKNRTSLTNDDRFMLRFEIMARAIDKRVHDLRKAGAKDEQVEAVQKKLNGTVERLRGK